MNFGAARDSFLLSRRDVDEVLPVSNRQLAGTLDAILAKQLAEADLTYQQLVDDKRRDLALRYIDDPATSITEINFLLGFSGQSAFTRAFRRWTGKSPTDFRANGMKTAA